MPKKPMKKRKVAITLVMSIPEDDSTSLIDIRKEVIECMRGGFGSLPWEFVARKAEDVGAR